MRWANSTLMKNYYERQKTSTLAQIDHLYTVKDETFRGFRHNVGKGPSADVENKFKSIAVEGKEIMDGLVNWEASQAQDGERFSNKYNGENSNTKGTKYFDVYLKRKKYRADEKRKNIRVNP